MVTPDTTNRNKHRAGKVRTATWPAATAVRSSGQQPQAGLQEQRQQPQHARQQRQDQSDPSQQHAQQQRQDRKQSAATACSETDGKIETISSSNSSTTEQQARNNQEQQHAQQQKRQVRDDQKRQRGNEQARNSAGTAPHPAERLARASLTALGFRPPRLAAAWGLSRLSDSGGSFSRTLRAGTRLPHQSACPSWCIEAIHASNTAAIGSQRLIRGPNTGATTGTTMTTYTWLRGRWLLHVQPPVSQCRDCDPNLDVVWRDFLVAFGVQGSSSGNHKGPEGPRGKFSYRDFELICEIEKKE